MPRLANGKIDTRALPPPVSAEAAVDATKPETSLEALIVDAMAGLLERQAFGLRQDFFAAGGNSLLAIRLVARIQRLLQLEVPPAVVFDNPSARQLASALQALEKEPGTLERTASLRRKLDQMSPDERAALMEKAKHARDR
jgi:hypothetical protein